MGWKQRARQEWEARHGAPPPRDMPLRAMRPARPLWPGLAPPLRYAAGMGLLGFCLWLPAFVALFRA